MSGSIEEFVDDRHQKPAKAFTSAPNLTFDAIDELSEQKEKLNRTIVASLNGELPVGAHVVTGLIYGPMDTGKSRLARAVAGESGAAFRWFPTIDHIGDGGEELLDAVGTAGECAPAVVVVEDFEMVVNSKAGYVRELFEMLAEYREDGRRVVLLGVMTPSKRPKDRFVLGQIDTLVDVPLPDRDRRAAILEGLLSERSGLAGDVIPAADLDFPSVAEAAEGFTISDLEAAARRAVQRAHTNADSGEGSVVLTRGFLREAITTLRAERELIAEMGWDSAFPGASQEEDTIDRELPDLTFDDIGGQAHAKQQLREYIQYPQEYPEFFEGTALDETRGILLYGPPGNGKTMLAKAIANETDRAFFSVAGPELQSKWVGETEQRIRELFEDAREVAPAVIFFDEFDSVAPERSGDRMPPWKQDFVNTLLAQMDGLEAQSDVVVIAATNHPDAIDPAIRRPGRLDRHIEVPAPDQAAYAEILEVHTRGLPVADDVDFDAIAADLPAGLSGAELAQVCREAAFATLRDGDDETTPMIGKSQFEDAVR